MLGSGSELLFTISLHYTLMPEYIIIFVRFSTCWPAFQKDTNGVLIVYNPDQANHDKELETW